MRSPPCAKPARRWNQPKGSASAAAPTAPAAIRQAVEGHRTDVSETTRNRHYALLRTILRLAATDWDWLEVALHIRLYKENNAVVRWLTPEEAASLIVELPKHLKGLVEFDLTTGLRMHNVTHLRWDKVDLERRGAALRPPFEHAPNEGGSDIGRSDASCDDEVGGEQMMDR
jgi:integrase